MDSFYNIIRVPCPDLTSKDVDKLKELLTYILGDKVTFTVQRYGKDENELLVYIGKDWKLYTKKEMEHLKALLNA